MSEERCIHHVKIGEVKTAEAPDILTTTLGSCVGIAFVWREKSRFALAHSLLPETTEPWPGINAKYVTHAIPSLIRILGIRPQDHAEIEVYVGGGANMFTGEILKKTLNTNHVGVMNTTAAENLLQREGFRIKQKVFGGTSATQIQIDCLTGKVEINHIQAGEKVKVVS